MLTIHPANQALKGTITVPGDKSVSHRGVMFGALAEGDTKITGFLNSADCLSTMRCFRAMGIEMDETESDVLVHGRGLHGLQKPADMLDVGNSGTTMRLMSGILAAQDFDTTVTGDASIRKRPMGRIIKPLTAMGADIESLAKNDCAPLAIRGRKLHGIDWESPVASAQVKSCVLLAALNAGVEASVTEPYLSRDHSERMLAAFGVPVTTTALADGRVTVRIPAGGRLVSPGLVAVPGDISSAAYFLCAALMVPGSELLIRHVGINPTRAGILTVLEQMGADITEERTDDAVEPIADLRVRYTPLQGGEEFVIGGGLIPSLIDELPMLAVLATARPGRTVIRDAAELRVKESDRIAVMTDNLRRMGARIEGTADGFVIDGPVRLHGAEVESVKDHRIAMSLAVAALVAEGDTVIHDASCVDISYPAFYSDLKKIAANK